MLQDQDMFLKSATTSAVGFAYLNITPIAGDGMTFAWSAFGVPVTSVACGLDYYGSYTGALVFTETVTELRDESGELVLTARFVGVGTERQVT